MSDVPQWVRDQVRDLYAVARAQAREIVDLRARLEALERLASGHAQPAEASQIRSKLRQAHDLRYDWAGRPASKEDPP